MHIATLLHRAGFHKRSGIEVTQVVYLLLLWVWLKTESIGMFSRDAMQSFTDAKKDVMYDYLKRRKRGLTPKKIVIYITICV